MIARGRGISGPELTTIIVLSWCGIIFGVTWLIALVLAIVWKPESWIKKCDGCGKTIESHDTAEQLEKLHKLKQRGIISQKEFDAQKKKNSGPGVMRQTKNWEQVREIGKQRSPKDGTTNHEI